MLFHTAALTKTVIRVRKNTEMHYKTSQTAKKDLFLKIVKG